MTAPRRRPGLTSSSSLLLSAVTAAPGAGRARGAGAGAAAVKLREPVAVDALPLSSSSDNDNDDDENTSRGDLTRTTFQQPAEAKGIASAPASTRRRDVGTLSRRVRPPNKKLTIAVERKRKMAEQEEADVQAEAAEAQRAEDTEAERVRGANGDSSSNSSSSSSSSRGIKRARPKETEPAEKEDTKPRKAPPSPPSSVSLPSSGRTSSSSGGGGGGGGSSSRSSDPFAGRRGPRSVGYSKRPTLLVSQERTTAGAAASRAGSKGTKRKTATATATKEAKEAKEAEAVTPRFKMPLRLSPQQDSPPPAKFRHWEETAGDSQDKDEEDEDASKKPVFKWKGLVVTDADGANEDAKPEPQFKWNGLPHGPVAGDEGQVTASIAKVQTATKTKTAKTKSPSLSLSPSPSPPPPAKTTRKTYTDSTADLLKARRQKWRIRQEKKKKRQLQEGKPGAAAAALFDELEVETDAEKAPAPEPQAVFKMPASYDGRPAVSGPADSATGATTYGVDDDRPLDDLLVADSDDGDSSDSTLPLERPPATCPVCKAAVDDEAVRGLLVALLPGDAAVAAAATAAAATAAAAAAATLPREGGRKTRGREDATAADLVRRHLLRFDDKLRFCEGHRQRASRAAWVARGYPVIDWAALGGRLRRHYGHVRRILEDETPSVFRAAMESGGGGGSSGGGGGGAGRGSGRGTKRGGREDTGQTAVTPGYYGQKGLRVLTEAIVLEFAGLLRQRAVADRLIAARGSSQFVEAVLVPELAVQLIREDMGVGATEAQRILWESGTIGEDVHGEERDVVMEEDEGDEGDEDDIDRGW